VSTFPVAEVPTASGVAAVAQALPEAEDGRTTLEGVVIHDTSADPPTPYIQYAWREGAVRTKQLIFSGARGCAPTSGDLPCAPSAGSGSPDLPYGARIRVIGIITGDQLSVESIERL
jgi:hypothetical protein